MYRKYAAKAMTTTTIDYAYARFARERFPLPTEAQLVALERRIGVTLPEDYRRFILAFNGGYFDEPDIEAASEGCPEDALTFLSGIGASHPEAELGNDADLAVFDDNDPPKVVVVGATIMGGLIVLETVAGEDRGSIYLKQAYGDFHYLADGIEDFLGLLREPDEDPAA